MALHFKKDQKPKETSGFLPQFINYGVNLLKINHIELKESSTGKFQVKLWMEGPNMGPDFIGADLPDGTKAKGLVGKVNLGVYFALDDEFKMDSLMNNLLYIAEKAEVAEKVRGIEADTLEELLKEYTSIIKNKYMWFIVKADEYNKNRFALSLKEGKVGQDGEGKKIFQVFCKHANFGTIEGADVVINGVIFKLKGFNQVGSSIGKADILEFNPDYDLIPFEASDDEDDSDSDIPENEMIDTEDAPF